MDGKILFVDDEPEMCFMVANLLKNHGYDVITAENVDAALRQSDEMKLRLIILDVNLAGENGMALVPYLRRNHPDMPIILYTGVEHDDAIVNRALHQGATKYLRKGGPIDELVQAVEQAVK